MNEFDIKFQDKLKRSISCIQSTLCYNFEEEDENGYVSGDDNGFFVLCTTKKFSYVRIKHAILANRTDIRFKMYYAIQPENAFCEDKSKELGFFNGEIYNEIIELGEHGFNAFRFDFGFSPVKFEILEFALEDVPESEIKVIKKKRMQRYVVCIMQNLKNFPEIIKFVRHSGLKASVLRVKQTLKNEVLDRKFVKSTQQVVEPYRVTLKQPLEPNRKKVLHFIENFYTGGSSRLIIDIIEYYGHKYDHKIFTMAYRGEEEFLNIDVEVIDVTQKKNVLKMIEDYSPDIIHIHIWEGDWYHKVFDILESVKQKVIIENINTPIAPITRDYINRYVFVSNYVVDNFYNVGDARSQVIYPGSNFMMFTRELHGNYLALDTIGMVYRLGYDKLNQRSIDVFIKTVKKRPQTRAIIVGGGPQYEYYVDKVKKAGVYNNFLFTGYVPYVDLPEWYKKFTVFVAPVWQESFGQVSPFAMSMGIPVAGYDIGALNEIINNNRLLAKPEDSDNLSDILVGLLNDYDKCIEIGKFNQQRSQELFGVQKMVDDYFALYEELTNVR